MAQAADGALRVRRTRRATPDEAWGLIADTTRVGEGSPETTEAVWRAEPMAPLWARDSRWTKDRARRNEETMTVTFDRRAAAQP